MERCYCLFAGWVFPDSTTMHRESSETASSVRPSVFESPPVLLALWSGSFRAEPWLASLTCSALFASGERGRPAPLAAAARRLLTATAGRRSRRGAPCSRVAGSPLAVVVSRWSTTQRSRRASLATDHSGLSRSRSFVTRPRSGLKCMCPRRQRFTRSGPADRGYAARDGRGCVAANGECAGRSLRAALARGAGWGISRGRALARAPMGRSRRRERERAADAIGRSRRRNRGLGPRCRALSRAPSDYCNVDDERKRENGFGGTDFKQ